MINFLYQEDACRYSYLFLAQLYRVQLKYQCQYQCDQTVKCKVAQNYLKFAQNVTIAVLTRKWMYSNEAEKSEHTFWVLL